MQGEEKTGGKDGRRQKSPYFGRACFGRAAKGSPRENVLRDEEWKSRSIGGDITEPRREKGWVFAAGRSAVP